MWELNNNPIWQELKAFIKDYDYARLQISDDPNVCSKVNNMMAGRKILFDEVAIWARPIEVHKDEQFE